MLASTSPAAPTSWRCSASGVAIQLLLAGLLWVLLLRWRGLVPLVLLVFAIEPCLRSLSGHLKPVTAMGTPPDEALNWWVFPVLVLLLLMSLCPSDSNWQGPSRESSSSR
jgi:hypothetical protein